jgi:hypothetical protein
MPALIICMVKTYMELVILTGEERLGVTCLKMAEKLPDRSGMNS